MRLHRIRRSSLALSPLVLGAVIAACSAADPGARTDAPVAAPEPSAAPSSAPRRFEPAFVEGTPASQCLLHPVGRTDPAAAIPAQIDEDGVARFQVVRPTAPGDVEKLALDCTAPDGAKATYLADLRDEAIFGARPFDASRTRLDVRPALTGDPMAYSQAELIDRGYGLRPDPSADPSSYQAWLAGARRDLRELRAIPGRALTTRPKAEPPRSEGPGVRHVTKGETGVAATYPGWTGSILQGAFAPNATDATKSIVYAESHASWTVPAITLNAFGIGGTKISIWNGIGQTASQLIQNEVWVIGSTTAATYFVQTQCFPGKATQAANAGSKSVAFTPAKGDNVFSELWYCDANGNVSTTGGYACTLMTDTTAGTTWTCDKANDPSCSSYALDPTKAYNGNLGTTAEFIIENDGDELTGGTQGYWPDFTAPVTMSGGAILVTGANTQGSTMSIANDPDVNVQTDFAPATNPDHVGVSLVVPSSTVWSVTQAQARATQAAPSCRYGAAATATAGQATLSVQCTQDAQKDPIVVFAKSGTGAWNQLASFTAASSAPTIAASAGSVLTLLACSAPTSPDTWPVAPGDIGCDASATSVTVQGKPSCTSATHCTTTSTPPTMTVSCAGAAQFYDYGSFTGSVSPDTLATSYTASTETAGDEYIVACPPGLPTVTPAVIASSCQSFSRYVPKTSWCGKAPPPPSCGTTPITKCSAGWHCCGTDGWSCGLCQ